MRKDGISVKQALLRALCTQAVKILALYG